MKEFFRKVKWAYQRVVRGWDKELDKMIAGFIASKKLRDLDYNWRDKAEEQAVKKVFDEGMQSFVKHYHSLWD